MSVQLPQMAVSVLSVDSAFANGVLEIRFRGTADVEAQPELQHFVKALHAECRRLGATKVVMDFRELEFMNSSSFKMFVGWLAQVREQPAEEQYKITFFSNPEMLWQRRSLAALSCFAAHLVSIET
jgi:anti-anti-sigma factor